MTIRGFADLSVPPLPSFSERDTLKIPPAGVLSVTAWLRQPNCGMKEMINSAVQCVFCVLAAKAGFSFTRENFDLVFYSDAGPAGTIWITPM